MQKSRDHPSNRRCQHDFFSSILVIVISITILAVFSSSFNLDVLFDGFSTPEVDKENVGANTSPDTESTGQWVLVTDVSELAVGDSIVIVAQNFDYAISTTQNENYRSQASVEKNGNTVTFGDDVQIITLESGLQIDTFAFKVAGGYLGARATSTNTLRLYDGIYDHTTWEIVISDGITELILNPDSEIQRYLMYNKTSELFSTYSKLTQKSICIYKLDNSEQ